MVTAFKTIKNPYVFIVDTEYDKNGLMQFAGLLFEQIDKDNDIYQLSVSINTYIKKDAVDYYAHKFTGITKEFLQAEGVDIEGFDDILNEIFSDIEEKDVILVTHGVKNDRKVLKDAGLTFLPEHSYCTYKNSKKLLKRNKKLKLTDIANESGFFLGDRKHDAFLDAWATVSVFCFLNKIKFDN